jgi:hypothetical protein
MGDELSVVACRMLEMNEVWSHTGVAHWWIRLASVRASMGKAGSLG